MELSPETLEHLRNEALVALCRKKTGEELAEVEQRKEALLSTRSPFAVFSKRESKETFTRSLRAVDESAAALNHRVAQLDEIDRRISTVIRGDLEQFLEISSADYQQLSTSLRMLDVWQRKLRESSEYLLALAREIRELRRAAPGAQRTRAIAAVRDVTARLAATHQHLTSIAREVASALAVTGTSATLPPLAELDRTTWVQRLSVLSAQQIEVEGMWVETETRRFLATGLEEACAQVEPCRQALQTCANAYLDHYWQQLRAYSQAQCGTTCEVDSVIAEISAQYIEADLERYQREIAATPFLINR